MRRSLALFVLAGCVAIPTARQREVEAAIDSIRVGLKESEITAIAARPQSVTSGPFDSSPSEPPCPCTPGDDCQKDLATQRTRYEWRVARPMACRSATINVYTMDVYYDLAGIARCVESGHAIEFNPVRI